MGLHCFQYLLLRTFIYKQVRRAASILLVRVHNILGVIRFGFANYKLYNSSRIFKNECQTLKSFKNAFCNLL